MGANLSIVEMTQLIILFIFYAQKFVFFFLTLEHSFDSTKC